jgi:hypothetical protein
MLAPLDAFSPALAVAASADEPLSAPPTALSLAEPGAAPLAALADEGLSPRFCAWRGASGRRYIFSAYPAAACPAYCDAVLIAVDRDFAGRRRAVAFLDTGTFPEPVLARAAKSLAALGDRLEFHLHLLAATAQQRAATIADLAAAAHPARS